MKHPLGFLHLVPILGLLCLSLTPSGAEPLELEKGSHVVLVGGNLGSRMLNYGHFETELHVRYPDLELQIRNLCDGGDTAGFRPHSAREPDKHWAFPGAQDFNPEFQRTVGKGFNETPDEWLTRFQADVVIGFFGFSESYRGQRGVEMFKNELQAFLDHTRAQQYNGTSAPQVALVSPIAFQDLSADRDLPNGLRENVNLQVYTEAMREVASRNQVTFVDVFTPTKSRFDSSEEELTVDGSQLNEAGYQFLNPFLIDGLFGGTGPKAHSHRDAIHAAVAEKNWLWINDYKIPNGVHVFGRRYNPYGPANYPAEIEKIRQMTDIRDQAIWAAAQGRAFDVAAADAKTRELPPVETNYKREITYLSPEDSLAQMSLPEGYRVEAFASEVDFPDLANPVQMAFDNRGRLWVSVMPSYPHWRPGDPKPNDKIIILEDTDGDNRADKQTNFAENLHLPMGFEISHDGVYVAQGVNLLLLQDTDGDDKADHTEIILCGFDDHDTHHAIGAFCTDPSGAIFMAEGVFLNTNVETAYGTIRGTNGGFYRYNPHRRHLERALQVSIPNPWGIAFDHWGQGFYLHTSGPSMNWMTPYRTRPTYGTNLKTHNLLTDGQVRPTSGLEFVSSRHFPEEVQGDVLLCNNIGFQGVKQHRLVEDGTGYKANLRHDLLVSKDLNVRPVDLEFAPDGSLYIVDWHNGLVGHMQHNARDPNRDHVHGRILRITYPSRPLVKPPTVAGAPIETLVANLSEPEYRTRYRTRRELRAHEADQVIPVLASWVKSLDASDPHYDHHLLEALWTTWGLNQVDETLLGRCLASQDHRVRAAAVNVLHYNPQLPGYQDLLLTAAGDSHGRVQMEAVSAASWGNAKFGEKVLAAVKDAAANQPTEKEEEKEAAPSDEITEKNLVFTAAHEVFKTHPVTEVEITIPGKGTINLCEIEIDSGGRNIAPESQASQSSQWNSKMGVDKMLDGDKTNLGHTKENEKNPWMRFAFERPVSVDAIRIWNRKGYTDRINGAKLNIRNGEKLVASFTLRSSGGGSGSSSPVEGLDEWLGFTFANAEARFSGQPIEVEPEHGKAETKLTGTARELYLKGHEIFNREAHCGTCHQPHGKGLPEAGFPPLAGTNWATGSEERLIKLTLKGLMGPIEVQGRAYPGLVPMTPFEALLNDEEIAATLTYVRNSFGNEASVITPEAVKAVRKTIADKSGFYSPEELLKEHPLEK